MELAEVEPLVQAAKSAVGDIKAESLAEIRALRAPPLVIRDILTAVVMLMGILDFTFFSFKRYIACTQHNRDIKGVMTDFRVALVLDELQLVHVYCT